MALDSNYFVGIYIRGPKWLRGKVLHKQPLEARFAYMEKLQDSHVLVLGSPFKDDEGALAATETSELSEARLIFAADPGVQREIFRIRVHPWFVSVEGRVSQKL